MRRVIQFVYCLFVCLFVCLYVCMFVCLAKHKLVLFCSVLTVKSLFPSFSVKLDFLRVGQVEWTGVNYPLNQAFGISSDSILLDSQLIHIYWTGWKELYRYQDNILCIVIHYVTNIAIHFTCCSVRVLYVRFYRGQSDARSSFCWKPFACVLMIEIFHQLRAAVCPFMYGAFHAFYVAQEWSGIKSTNVSLAFQTGQIRFVSSAHRFLPKMDWQALSSHYYFDSTQNQKLIWRYVWDFCWNTWGSCSLLPQKSPKSSPRGQKDIIK